MPAAPLQRRQLSVAAVAIHWEMLPQQGSGSYKVDSLQTFLCVLRCLSKAVHADTNNQVTSMKSIIIAAALLACAVAIPVSESGDGSHHWFEFGKFVQQHGKSYSSVEEFSSRFAVFKNWLNYIETHNAKADKTFELAVNKFADHTWEEFKSMCDAAALFLDAFSDVIRCLQVPRIPLPEPHPHLLPPNVCSCDGRSRLAYQGLRECRQGPGPVRFMLGLLRHRLARVRQLSEEWQAAQPVRAAARRLLWRRRRPGLQRRPHGQRV